MKPGSLITELFNNIMSERFVGESIVCYITLSQQSTTIPNDVYLRIQCAN